MMSFDVQINGSVTNNFDHFLVTVSDGTITSLREYMARHRMRHVFIDARDAHASRLCRSFWVADSNQRPSLNGVQHAQTYR